MVNTYWHRQSRRRVVSPCFTLSPFAFACCFISWWVIAPGLVNWDNPASRTQTHTHTHIHGYKQQSSTSTPTHTHGIHSQTGACDTQTHGGVNWQRPTTQPEDSGAACCPWFCVILLLRIPKEKQKQVAKRSVPPASSVKWDEYVCPGKGKQTLLDRSTCQRVQPAYRSRKMDWNLA